MVEILAVTQTQPQPLPTGEPVEMFLHTPLFYAVAAVVIIAAYFTMVCRSEKSAIGGLLVALLGIAALFGVLGAWMMAGAQVLTALFVAVALSVGNAHLRSAQPTGPVTGSSFVVRTVMGMMYAMGLFGLLVTIFVFDNASAWDVAPAGDAIATADDAGRMAGTLVTDYLVPVSLLVGLFVLGSIASIFLVWPSEDET